MKYSISEASRVVGVTRKTLYKHIDKKPITVEKDNNDRPVIDASELIRVYGDQCKFDFDSGSDDTEKSKHQSTEVSNSKSTEIAVIKKELELVRGQFRSEKENFEEQIDYLRKKLDEANGESRKLTAQITDQREKVDRTEEWDRAIKALEERIANQEKIAKQKEEREEKLRREQVALKKALEAEKKKLEAEKNKSVWKKLFGS